MTYGTYQQSVSPAPATATSGYGVAPAAPAAAPAAAAAPMQMQTGNPYLTPDMLYQQLGYYNPPTEVDIDIDLLNNTNEMATFLAEEGGLSVLASLVSVVVDHRLKNFFESFTIGLMEAEDGSGLFLKPRTEQISEEGARIKGLTPTTVQAELSAIGNHLKVSLVDPGRSVLNTHRQAATLAASSSFLSALETAAGGDPSQGPGMLTNLLNWGAHAATGGFVPRIQPNPMTGPSMPPMQPPQ
tara:strand:+ start:404 stop:1129 length:726 start_codon:yes stop_codon:yes gene_type:complete